MTYEEKLQDRRWLNKRTEILLRDNWTCQRPDCNTKYNDLQIHHLDYIPNIEPWNYPNDMLITICRNHHQEELMRDKVEMQMCNALKMKGFFISDLLRFTSKIDIDIPFTQTFLNILRKDQDG